MPLRALRKAMVAFATFDSVAACRACTMQNSPSRHPEAALPEAIEQAEELLGNWKLRGLGGG